MVRLLSIIVLLAVLGPGQPARSEFPVPLDVGLPRAYACRHTRQPVTIDGRLDDQVWQHADWTENFIDIQGPTLPPPRLRTRAKMLWDDQYFYVGVRMGEPHVWGKLSERDAVIYYDNDFEVFIDPDGDNHLYYGAGDQRPGHRVGSVAHPPLPGRSSRGQCLGHPGAEDRRAHRWHAERPCRTGTRAGRWKSPFPGMCWPSAPAAPRPPNPATSGA
jgi:hypothetical protein